MKIASITVEGKKVFLNTYKIKNIIEYDKDGNFLYQERASHPDGKVRVVKILLNTGYNKNIIADYDESIEAIKSALML